MKVEAVEQKIRSFYSRLDQAMLKSPPSKRWVKDAIHMCGADRCPVRLRRLGIDLILKYGDDLADLFCRYGEDTLNVQAYEYSIGLQNQDSLDKINPIRALTTQAEWTDEWGALWGHAADGVGATTLSTPLSDWSMLDKYLAECMPDPHAKDRFNAVMPILKMHGRDRYFAGMSHFTLFERFHCLRGMENTFVDFYANPVETERLLEALTEYYIGIIQGWSKLEGVDAIFMTDDWGTQQTLMISPDMWRHFFVPRYRRIFDEAHRYSLDVIFHSCGNMFDIIGDLIELGVDVVDPLQPEAMDIAKVAREFGGKVAFCGGLSDQRIVTNKPAQVKDEVRKTIDILGHRFKNAYIVAPSNMMTPEIPFENIIALFEACHEQ